MRERVRKIVDKIVQIIGSKYFFWGIIVLFVFQAAWIAFSFRYPMIYDEGYHFGLIEYFSHQWLPWITNQSTNLDQYGALGRDPYLLYHYLMSFPFRIIDVLTNNPAVQVISMRLINIILFASGIISFWHLLKEMNIKRVFRNVSLLFFVLLPATPFVAATINYDSAVFLLTAIFMLVGVKIVKNQKIQWHHYALLVFIGMTGSLMKSAFTPIFAAGFIFIVIRLLINHKKQVIHDYIKSFKTTGLWLKIVILVPVVVVGFLFTERFAVNIVQYHSLVPSCEKQLTEKRCLSSPLELRAYELEKNKKGKIPYQDPEYVEKWGSSMLFTLLWSGSSIYGSNGVVKFLDPLPVIYTVVFISTMVSSMAFFYSFEKLKKISGFWFITSIIILYISTLFYINFSAYYKYYSPIGIQGRYLLPLLPVLMALALLGINNILRRVRPFKILILITVFILYLSGAGVITHIVRSNDSWIWDNQTVRQMNDDARDWLSPYVQKWWYDK